MSKQYTSGSQQGIGCKENYGWYGHGVIMMKKFYVRWKWTNEEYVHVLPRDVYRGKLSKTHEECCSADGRRKTWINVFKDPPFPTFLTKPTSVLGSETLDIRLSKTLER